VVEELAPPSPPAPIEPPEGLDEEGLYVFHERVGIGLELGMTEEAAAEIAGVEAWLAHTTNTRLRELGAKAIEGFGGAWAVEVRNITKEPTS
jgi:aldehyde:ferredoxin oxidoreductase